MTETVTAEDNNKIDNNIDDDDDNNDDDGDDNDANDDDDVDNVENNSDTRANTQGINNYGISPEKRCRGFDNNAQSRLRIIGFLEFLVR